MIFDIERKYIIAVVLFLIGLSAGGFIWLRQEGMLGRAAAGISRGTGTNGQWMEIKPRIEPSQSGSSSTDITEESLDSKSKNAKAKSPSIQWCVFSVGGSPAQEVIINEVAWMGNAQSYSDEWIELKNVSDNDVDLSGWQLQDKSQKIKISFNQGERLAAGGFYLLERTDDDSVPGVAADKVYKGTLGNSNEALYLFSAGCELQDMVTAVAKWIGGDNLSKKTMMRNSDLSWQTSRISGGTPKSTNK